MINPTLFTFCSIRDCKLPAESIRALKLPFCFSHQSLLINNITDRINELTNKQKGEQ